MSQVSFDTAKSLREAGMPQPKPEPGQFRYDESGLLFIVSETTSSTTVEIFLIGVQSVFKTESIDRFVYAPTVSDIIPLIGNNALIKFRKDETGQIWECNIDEGDGIEKLLGYHETNPAEAAAMAWLQLNENGQSANDWLDSVTNETPKS